MHFARIGYSVALLMEIGRSMLGLNQVLPGVEVLVDEVQIEATFPDGIYLYANIYIRIYIILFSIYIYIPYMYILIIY